MDPEFKGAYSGIRKKHSNRLEGINTSSRTLIAATVAVFCTQPRVTLLKYGEI